MTKLRDLLAAMKERSKVLDQQRQTQAKVDSISDKIPLNSVRRGENLRLLRAYLNVHQEPFASALNIGSQSLLSQIERGEAELDDVSARRVELDLHLPPGWLDRNNGDAIFLTNDEIHLIQELRKSDPGATTSLVAAVKTIQLRRGGNA